MPAAELSTARGRSGVDPPPAGPQPQVLLVDDQPARLLTYEALLENTGVGAVRALSGLEALGRLEQEPFAAIVLDVNMPEMDGFETARRIRADPRFGNTPLIFVTGVSITELDRLRGYEVGAVDYMPLPLVPEIFRAKVALLVELHSRRIQLQRLNEELRIARAGLEATADATRSLVSKGSGTAPGQAGAAAMPAPVPSSGSTASTQEHWLSALLEAVDEEVYLTDATGRYLSANSRALREFGHTSLAGQDVIQVVGKLDVRRGDGTPRTVAEAPPLRALSGEIISGEEQIVRNPRSGELRHRRVSAAPVRNDAGNIIGSVSVVADITSWKRAEHDSARRESRAHALLRLGDKFRLLVEPPDLAFAAAEILGQTLGVSRCGYGTVDPVAETITIERDWNSPGIQSLAGTLHFRDYGTYIDELKRGEIVVCVDAQRDPRTAVTAHALRAIQVQSFVNMPVTEQQGTVALLYLTHDTARDWPEDELAFIRDVAERTRVAVERRRNEQALAVELESMRRLRDLAARLITEEDARVLFEEILAAAIFLAKANGGTIQLLDPNSGSLVFAATRGLDPALIAQLEKVTPGSGSSCGLALSSRQRVFVEFDQVEDPDGSRRIHREFGFRSAQSTPLVSRSGRLLGMFSTYWREQRLLKEREHRFLDLLAHQAADLIDRQETSRALREADQRKDEFIAMLSHELRNPLVPIRNGVKLLQSMPDPQGLLAKLQPMMERQISHTIRLIDDLLDTSRITSGRIDLQRTQVTIDAIISTAVEAHRDQVAAKGIELRLDIGDSQRVLHVDGTRIVQVLSNLLSNAVKFTPKGGRVELIASFTGQPGDAGQLMLQVRDSGCGISADELPHVFELFGRASPPGQLRSAESGLGVGLGLARKIVELHGGQIHAFSAGLGHGAEFVVSLPTGMPAHWEDLQATGESLPAHGRVLIVDDNADAADSVVIILQSAGFEAKAAYRGEAAIELARTFLPQFAVLDIGMPGMDGHELCQRLRKTYGNGLRIVALTGWGSERDRRKSVESGFDAHLTKPVDPDALAAVLLRLGQQPIGDSPATR